ncbi:MAG: 16S rRNA (guanine(527)-N(7))-methyltransferase RsmG [Terriglobales bacterium]
MNTARIAALLDPFLEPSLPPSQLDQISIYIDLLLRWNARINLTSIRSREEIVTRHFGESFFLARYLFPAEHVARTPANAGSAQMAGVPLIAHSAMSGTPPKPPRVLDIGSGAGFPALPLKIWAPHIHLTLIESNHKKAAFLREVARALTLTNINVITDRAEVLAARPDFPHADIVTLRAVEHFDTILPQAVTLLAPNATLALLEKSGK